MSQSYYGSVEVGPHWCQGVLFESVAEREQLGADLLGELQNRAALSAQLMRDNPSLDLKRSEEQALADAKAVAELDRSDAVRASERAAEIWAEILPITGQMGAKLHELPPEFRLWALAQVVGDAISGMSDTKKDAIARHCYLDKCVAKKIGEVFHQRDKGAIRK